jgi:ATP-dependent DNA helicase DinG
VVSTNTITLQEQLFAKDLPFLKLALTDQQVRFALLKGWKNYLCLQRLEQARLQGPRSSRTTRRRISGCSRTGRSRHRTARSPTCRAAAPEVWDEVAAEGDLCTRLKCPHFDPCFVFKARRAAAQADVVVVNHHLLMADIAVRRASGLGRSRRAAGVQATGDRRRASSRRRGRGALGSAGLAARARTPVLPSRAAGQGSAAGVGEEAVIGGKDLYSVASLDLVRARLVPSLQTARTKSAELCDLLGEWMRGRSESVVRLTDSFDDEPVWQAGLSVALDDLLTEVDLLGDGLRMVRDRLESDEAKAEELAPLLNEIRGVTRRLQSASDALRAALRPGRDGAPRVRWLELRGSERNVGATAVPLDLSPILREDLFRRVETAIVTSATLSVGDGFDFITRRLGLDDEELEPVTASLASPFDYPRQAMLLIPSDFPAPNADGPAHLRRTLEATRDVIAAAQGGVFVLFTSHRDVREAAAALRAAGAEAAHPLLVHGEAPRDELLRRFREHGDAVLIGTASFWEGVDVPGRALRGMVIAKIPFRVPTEPMTAAQCEAIEAAGGDAFAEYMIPHAALRLKQGFGRLIRTATDRGAVVICDPRVVTKGYGRRLTEGLPPATRLQGPWAMLRDELRAFYEGTLPR